MSGPYPNFPKSELSCHCGCGAHVMDPIFMAKVVAIRGEYGRPMVLSSARRCYSHNLKVGGKLRSRHLTGGAVDVLCWGANAHRLLEIALNHGIKSAGLHQRGLRAGRFIHLDNRPGRSLHTY